MFQHNDNGNAITPNIESRSSIGTFRSFLELFAVPTNSYSPANGSIGSFTKFVMLLKRAVIFSVLALYVVALPAFSQALSSATNVDLQNPSSAGSFSLNSGVTPPTYTIQGGGDGGFVTSEQSAFTNVPTSGNIELRARVVSQSSANANARAGLMIRSAYTGNALQANINVDSAGVIRFNYRAINGNSQNVSGSTVTLPVYLRLVKNGDTIAGYSSTDDETWTLVGSNTTTGWMPNLFYAGICSANGANPGLNTAVFDYLAYMVSVPQKTSNLIFWLRADDGVTSAAGAVSQWNDVSGNGLNATQAVGANKPTFTAGALNHGTLGTILFNGTSQYLTTGSNFANLTGGASIFVVMKATNNTSTGTLCAFGNAANSDAVFVQQVATQAALNAYNSTTSSVVTTTSGPINTAQYQLFETTLKPGATSGTAVGTVFFDGVQKIQSTSMQNLNNISRTNNVIGAGIGPGSYFNGNIAEVLVYNVNVTDSLRKSIEAYVLSKYGTGNQPTADNPVLTPGAALVTSNQAINVSQSQNAITYFTIDGTTPTNSSQWFNSAHLPQIIGSVTLKAKAVAPFFTDSAVVSAKYDVDNSTLPVPRNGMVLWLRPDMHVTTSGSNVSNAGDLSGSSNDASQGTGGNQPTLAASAVNFLPAFGFTSPRYFQLPAGFANFTSGASIFAVIKPNSVTAGARIIDFGNGATSDNLNVQEPTSTGAAMYAFSGSTSSNVTSTSALALGEFRLLEAIHNGAGTGTILTNSVQGVQGTVNNLNNILRSNNFVGQGSAGGNNLEGQIAELIVFNRAVTASERAAIEGYLLNRFQMPAVNAPAAPKLSLATGTYTAPVQVSMEAPAQAIIRFTTDGTTPTISSPIFTAPLTIAFTQQVQAIAVVNGVSSSVTSATYTLDSTQFPAPSSTSTPLQLDIQTPQLLIPHDNNQH